jgi:hypothetical protein
MKKIGGDDHFGLRIAGDNTATGINYENPKELFKVYPNPSENYFPIQLLGNKSVNLEI